ncbi:MAG TPA: cation:proton antiporter, partial [Polyangia bacterium]|nr:cation:proton antiporter [Polyangia bacterium]
MFEVERVRGTGWARVLVAYAAMVAGAVALFWWIRALGERLVVPPSGPPSGFGRTAAGGHGDTLLHVLLALVVIIVCARALGTLFRALQQPPVLGEVLAGILLGPSLLGRLWPEAAAYVLPPAIAPSLGILAQVGVILFMFLVGLELDTRLLRRGLHAALAISHASIVVPFVLGAATALWLYPRLSSPDVPFTIFALFMGVSMSVTAFPVLARILTDRGLQRTTLGVLAISCAAVDDVTAWCLLALVVSVAHAQLGNAVVTVGLTLGYVLVMFLVVRPLLIRLGRSQERRQQATQAGVAAVLVALLGSAVVTESIGVHALFGAFLLGAMIPPDSLLARQLTQK